MKKKYIAPEAVVYSIAYDAMLATSIAAPDGPGTGEDITTDNAGGYEQDGRHHNNPNLWDNMW